MMRITMTVSPTRCGFGPILFAGDLEQGLAEAGRLGYDGVELNLRDSRALDQGALMARLEELGLFVGAIATGQTWITDGWSLYHPDGAAVRKALDRLQGHIDFAARLGCMVITGGIRGRIAAGAADPAGIRERGLAALRECAAYAADRGVTLLLEPINRYETDLVNTTEEGLELIDRTGAGNIKLLLDTFHMNIEDPSIEDGFRRAGARLGYVHLVDSNRRAPGLGHLDFARLLKVLDGMGYDGILDFEVLPLPSDRFAAERAIGYVRGLMCGLGGKEAKA